MVRNRQQQGGQGGFTLIELMMVVAVIGILAAVAIPSYQDYVRRGYVSEGLGLASTARKGVEEYYAANGVYPANNSSAGLSDASAILGEAVSSVAISGGNVVVTYNNKVSDGATLIFVPVPSSGSIGWSCANGTLATTGYVPPNCRG